MTDNMDKLLYSIGAEEDAGVDYAAMYQAILAASEAPPRKRPAYAAHWRMAGAAAAFLALIGVGSLALSRMWSAGSDNAAAYTAALEDMPAEAAIVEESMMEAPAAPAPAPAEARTTDAPAAEAQEAEAISQPAAEPADQGAEHDFTAGDGKAENSVSGAGGSLESHAALNPDLMVALGAPLPGLEAELESLGLTIDYDAEYFGHTVTPGRAYVDVDPEGRAYALWNTGSGCCRIRSGGPGLTREGLIALLSGLADGG